MKRWLIITAAVLVLGVPLVLIVVELNALERHRAEDHAALVAALEDRQRAIDEYFQEWDRQHAENMKLAEQLEAKLLVVESQLTAEGLPPE